MGKRVSLEVLASKMEDVHEDVKEIKIDLKLLNGSVQLNTVNVAEHKIKLKNHGKLIWSIVSVLTAVVVGVITYAIKIG